MMDAKSKRKGFLGANIARALFVLIPAFAAVAVSFVLLGILPGSLDSAEKEMLVVGALVLLAISLVFSGLGILVILGKSSLCVKGDQAVPKHEGNDETVGGGLVFDCPCLEKYEGLRIERPELFVGSRYFSIEPSLFKMHEYSVREDKKLGVVYESPYNQMVVDLVKDSSGNVFPYERVIPSVAGCGVLIVPVLKGEFVMLKQFRHAIRGNQFAFPRGFSSGLGSEADARRELKEELGADAINLRHLGRVCADSGLTSGCVEVYSCEISSYSVNAGKEGILGVIEVDPNDFLSLVKQDDAIDGLSLAAYALY